MLSSLVRGTEAHCPSLRNAAQERDRTQCLPSLIAETITAGQATYENCKMTRVVLQNRCGTTELSVQKTDLQDHGFSRPAFPERFAGPHAQSKLLVVSRSLATGGRRRRNPQRDWLPRNSKEHSWSGLFVGCKQNEN